MVLKPKVVPVLTVANNKGGVGKSALCAILAEGFFHLKNLRVLIADFDGQCNSTETYVLVEMINNLGKMPCKNPLVLDLIKQNSDYENMFEERSTLTDLFNNKLVMPYETAFFDEDSGARIDVISANAAGFEYLLESTPTESEGSPYAHFAKFTTNDITDHLVRFCSDPELAEEYDIVIIDSGPSVSPLFKAALRAATHLICPYTPESNGVSGVHGLMTKVIETKRNRGNKNERAEALNFIGVFPNKVESKTDDHINRILEVMSSAGDYHLPGNIAIRQLTDITRYIQPYQNRPKGKNLFKLKPSSLARQDCDPLVNFVYDAIFNN